MAEPSLYSVFVSFNPESEAIDVWKRSNGTEPADPLDVAPGEATIRWQPIDGQEGQWRFIDLRGLPNPPFGRKEVKSQRIEIADNNAGDPQPPYHYRIEIVANGASYQPDPQIRNLPSAPDADDPPSG